LLLEFPSAFHAVRASLGVQRLMAERNIEVPADKRLVFRMGIHLGDVIVDNDDIFGDGVNIAARLQEIAGAGWYLPVASRPRDDPQEYRRAVPRRRAEGAEKHRRAGACL
jgi:class 3 adenylate cyclase